MDSSSPRHNRNRILLPLLLTILATLPSTPTARKTPLPPGVFVEGVAHARGTLFLGGDLPSGNIILSDAATGLQTTIVQAPPGRLAVGIAVNNPKSTLIFAAGGGEVFFERLNGAFGEEYNDYGAVKGAVHVYEMTTGNSVASCNIGGAVFVNDVIVDGDFVYATDSARPFVYRLRISAFPRCFVKRIPLPGDYFAGDGFRANGIEVYKGGLLVVNSHSNSLHYIDLQRNNTPSVVLPAGRLPGGDGIAIRWSEAEGGELRLYAADNENNWVNVYALSFDWRTRRVKARRRGSIRRPGFTGTTTTVAVGGGFVVVPNLNRTAVESGTQGRSSLACAKI